MNTMLSWHKIGQNVTMGSARVWNVLEGAICGDEPEFGRIYTVSKVCSINCNLYFQFEEIRDVSLFDAASFVPVYPTIVEQLRRLDAPMPERVTREAEPATVS